MTKLKELRTADSNADYLKMELETIRRSPEKLKIHLLQCKPELKALNSRMNNAEA